MALLKVAVADLAASMVRVQLAVPEQAPLQPEKTEPLAGVGVRVTEAPLVTEAEQLAPQLIPAGLLVTVPLPVPALLKADTLLTVRAKLADVGALHDSLE